MLEVGDEIALVAESALTTVTCGTRATAVLPLDSRTTAPCVIGAAKRTVPVAFCPPTIEVGTKETEDRSVRPGRGVHGEVVGREMLSAVAPMFCTMVGGLLCMNEGGTRWSGPTGA